MEDAPKSPATGPRWMRLACYFPLMAIGLEIAWSVLLFIGLIFMVGDAPYENTPEKERLFNLIGGLPVDAGLVVGIIALVKRWPARKVEWVCLILGTLVCAALVWSCVTG